MQTQPDIPADDTTRQARANILRVTARQLGTWSTGPDRHQILVPKADADAWEGTEIDVRRTVL